MTPQAREVFTTLRLEVMAGQYLDLRLERHGRRRPEAARRVALLKSGRYTVTRPLELGLALAGATDARWRRAAGAYGDAIGLAFQLRDDILGVFGDPCDDRQERGRRPPRRQAHGAHAPGDGPGDARPSERASNGPSATPTSTTTTADALPEHHRPHRCAGVGGGADPEPPPRRRRGDRRRVRAGPARRWSRWPRSPSERER